MTSNTGKDCDTAVVMQANAQKRGRKRKSAKMFQKWQFAPISFPEMQSEDFSEMPIVISCKIAQNGITVMKVHVDNGSSVDVVYEHCFVQLPEKQLSLNIEFFDENNANLVRQAELDFYVMRTSSRYNMLLGRSALGKFGIVPSTIHGMIKFTTRKGVATCSKECTDAEDNMVVVNLEYPDQKLKLTSILVRIQKRRLSCSPEAQGYGPDCTKWLCEEVTKLVAAGILREVKYQSWVMNPVLVKKPDGSWRMCIDFKDLNKACPKDNYPLPDVDLKVKSLHAFPFKYFLDAARGYHQIPMAKEDEDKTAFHTGKSIFSYIMLPFGLINAGATYQRLVDTAFETQIGRNLEAYVDDFGNQKYNASAHYDRYVRNI
ncbi:uncharacterized protein [Rutidosis leptorrhynchoides]|uniref:uncharacterized protein n=1 Tax=Rutidosis leptorrhynchoides TaxID=125765 RepID=UPI003A99CAD0